MGKFRLNFHVFILQFRFIQTKASKTLNPPIKLAVVEEINSKSKKSEIAAFKLGKKQTCVVNFLKSQQFSDTQIAELAKRRPAVLNCRIATNLEPKFKFFIENGLGSYFLADLITKNPSILFRSLNAHLIPSLKYVKSLLLENNEMDLVKVLRGASWLLTLCHRNNVQSNVELLLKEGVAMNSISKLFRSYPRCFCRYAHEVAYMIEIVKKSGIKPSELRFMHVYRALATRSDLSLKKRLENLKSLGWSDEDIISTIMKVPNCLTCSENNIKSTMEFWVETMKVTPRTVIAYPKLLMYSLEKRIIPRWKALVILHEKKLSTGMPTTLMCMTEERFVRKLIKYQKQVPDLLNMYRGWKMDGVSIQK